MSRKHSGTSTDLEEIPPDFSLVLGGPLFQIMRKLYLSGSALELLHRRVIIIPLICWVPLLILSALQGQFSGNVDVPFLLDFQTHIRFLVAVPLLLTAEVTVFRRTRSLIGQFLRRDLIDERDMPRFEAAITSAIRLRNSIVVEVLLLVIVYAVGVLVIWRQFVALDSNTWYAQRSGYSWEPSLAGMWLSLVSLPVFQFLVLRWYYRIFVWSHFLWQVSRIPLRLVPTHPDGAGGAGFLAGTVYSFTLLLLAHGVMLSGLLADRIFHAGAVLTDFKFELIAMIVMLICLVYGPLMVFSSALWNAKQAGMREYGAIAQDYVRAFDSKWLLGGGPSDEILLGNADVQSLADLASSYDLVKSMQTTLITKERVFYLAWVIVLPILPLALTMMPLEELLKRLVGIFF